MSVLKAKRIKTFLWFDGQAEDAAGSVMTVEFELDGHPFVGLNAGPQFKFNESVSFAVECETQEEIEVKLDIAKLKEAAQ